LYLYLHRKKDARPGNVFLMYLALYGLGRVFIEPMRTDSLYIPGTNLRVSQVLSAILIVGSVAALIFRNMGDRKPASGDEVGASPDMDEIDPNLVLVRKEHRRNLTAETEGEAQPADGGSEQDAADAEDTGDAGDTGYAGDAGESPAQSEEPEQTGGETGEPADESQGETAQEAENGGEDKP
jgi:phosphatidylglycerol:prolipoprotein diacylglycerol transferase